MNKILLTLVLICALAGAYSISGCKKNSASEGKLIGKWIFVSIQQNSVVNGVSTPFTQGFDGGSYFQFNADKSYDAIIDLSFQGTWQLDGSRLLLTSTGDSTASSNFDVRTLTARELVLYLNEPNDSGYAESTWHLKKSGS